MPDAVVARPVENDCSRRDGRPVDMRFAGYGGTMEAQAFAFTLTELKS
jgi:hypothetical protein